jgi:hypothetical protein
MMALWPRSRSTRGSSSGELAAKLRDLVDVVDAGERPFLEQW